MTAYIAKDLGISVVQEMDFMSRPGIYWKWKSPIFDGLSFGSQVGPRHCFFQGGFHDFAHCIDFILRGKTSRILLGGLEFRRPWEKFIPALGISDGNPKTSSMTRCEGRVFALQAYLQTREMGFIVEELDYDRENELQAAGALDHLIVPSRDDRERGFSMVESMSIEEFAHVQGKLESFKWRDDMVFIKERGFAYSAGDPKDYSKRGNERKKFWKESFENFIIQEYKRLDNPFVERRISRAITTLGERMRYLQKNDGFVPTDSHMGVRPSRFAVSKEA